MVVVCSEYPLDARLRRRGAEHAPCLQIGPESYHVGGLLGTELHRELILVVPFTDVGWTPLLSLVGGVVAESGGILSHTSIIAREYGLPAVVNVERATTLIRDGEQITVDGDHGRVCFDDRRTGERSTP